MIWNCSPEPDSNDLNKADYIIYESDNDDVDNPNVYSNYQRLGSSGDDGELSDESSDDEWFQQSPDVTEVNTPNTNNANISCQISNNQLKEPTPLFPPPRNITVNSEQVRSAMANIKLPASATPSWAMNIPESELDQIILNRVFLKSNESTTGN